MARLPHSGCRFHLSRADPRGLRGERVKRKSLSQAPVRTPTRFVQFSANDLLGLAVQSSNLRASGAAILLQEHKLSSEHNTGACMLSTTSASFENRSETHKREVQQ